MPINTILGVIFIAFGLLTSLVGIGGGIQKMVSELPTKPPRAYGDTPSDPLSQTLSAFSTLLETMKSADTWLAIFGCGAVLIFIGVGLLGIQAVASAKC
jgi:hypothetical protein